MPAISKDVNLKILFLPLGAAVCDWLCVLYKHFYCCLHYLPLLLHPFVIKHKCNQEIENVLDAYYLQGCAPGEPFSFTNCSSVCSSVCVVQTLLLLTDFACDLARCVYLLDI